LAQHRVVKLIYSENAKKNEEIPKKKKKMRHYGVSNDIWRFFQISLAFSEYMSFAFKRNKISETRLNIYNIMLPSLFNLN
jgi:hypothetical protein